MNRTEVRRRLKAHKQGTARVAAIEAAVEKVGRGKQRGFRKLSIGKVLIQARIEISRLHGELRETPVTRRDVMGVMDNMAVRGRLIPSAAPWLIENPRRAYYLTPKRRSVPDRG